MEIITRHDPQGLLEFKALAHNEWGGDVTFPSDETLNPILARQEGPIIGGLSYIHYPHPKRDEIALWINTVLVIPEWRKQGIGSTLIKTAMHNQAPSSELFVYTEIPSLYLQLDWKLVSTSKENHILMHQTTDNTK